MILAKDIDFVPGQGGLNELIDELHKKCMCNNIPFIQGLMRKQIGKAIKACNIKISAVGITNYDIISDDLRQLFVKHNTFYKL